jgi:receptor protein-tyrosine kinase
MSLIERAAEKLEQLKAEHNAALEPLSAEAVVEPTMTTPERAISALHERRIEPVVPDVATPSAPRRVSRLGTAHGPGKSKKIELDLARLKAAGFLTPDTARSQLADEFRVIKRPLIGNAKGRSASVVERANLIMVTSAFPGEGKSFTAINLAMSIAMELDNTVLLVDGDVAAPGLSEVLGLPKSDGLIEVLTEDGYDLADVLLKTNVEKLSVLPAGSPHVRNTELLASKAMTNLLDEMMLRYPDRIIVFDSPPLLPTTESRVLATHMGQIVVVVEADKTTHNAVAQAFATIEACPVVMTVLNKAAGSEMGRYYGYYQ